MWRWHFMPILVCLVILAELKPTVGRAQSTSRGPTSPEEAQILWEQGSLASQEARAADVVISLQRLIDRYPADSHRKTALYQLGRAYLDLSRPQEAIPLLEAFILSSEDPQEKLEARLLLGKSYFKLEKHIETLLVVREIETQTQTLRPSEDFRLQTLLLKSRALFHNHHPQQARLELITLEKSQNSSTRQALIDQIDSFKLELKLYECAQMTTRETMSELQAKAQIHHRASCLLEAVLGSKNVLKASDPEIQTSVTHELKQGFDSLHLSCLHPPSPPPLKDRKRTPLEVQRYRAELIDLVQPLCKQTRAQAQELYLEWKKHPDYQHSAPLSSLLEWIQKLNS